MDDARPLLTRLCAENVRSFASLDLDLGPLTVLVGPNGAGKSNIVAVLRFLRDYVRDGTNSALHLQRGGEAFLRRDSDTARVSAVVEGVGVDYSVNLGPAARSVIRTTGDGGSGPAKDPPRVEPVGPPRIVSVSAVPSTDNPETEATTLLITCIAVYQPEPEGLRDRVQRTDTEPALREDFGNLGAVLKAIRETPFGGELDRALALLVDGVTGYSVAQAGSTLVPQILYGPDDARDLGLESDGTIRLVALLAALYQPIPPSLIVLEEPEMGLHPGMLGALAEIIIEASDRMQVLVTTHSPDLMDGFDPDVLRVVEKVGGESVIGPMESTQRDLIHRRLYQPSELMRIEGLVREP